jgi:MFS family permease
MMETLRQRNFGLLWSAGLISLLGDQAMLVAVTYYVFVQTGSTLAMAAAFTAFYAPDLLLGSFAGIFADRWDRKRLMISTNVIQSIVMLPLLLVHSADHAWIIYAVIFVEKTMATFFGPAEGALLPNLVSDDRLISANSLTALNSNIARLAGPPVGAVLLAWMGIGVVAVADSVSFLAAAGLIALIAAPPRPARDDTVEAAAVEGASAVVQAWREWIDGLRLLTTNRAIASLFIVCTVTSFGGSMLDPVIAPWVRSVLHQGAPVLGLVTTTGAVGGIVGGMLLGQFGQGLSPARLFGVTTLLVGVVCLVMYNATELPLAAGALVPFVLSLSFIKSVPLVGGGAALETLFQQAVPDDYRGRMYGAIGTSLALVGMASLWISGTLAQLIGVTPVLSIGCADFLVAGLLGLVLLRDPEPSAETSGAMTG